MEHEQLDFENSKRASGFTSLQLSLYFFLLIFFILLNFNPHAVKETTLNKEALISVNKQFGKSNMFFIEDNFIERKEQTRKVFERYFINKIKKIIPEEVELEILTGKGTHILELQLSIIYLFVKDQEQLKNSQYEFLTELAKVIAKRVNGLSVITEISMNCVDFLEPEKKETMNLAVKRVAELSGYLINNGVDSNSIITTFKENMPGKVTLLFSLAEEE